MINNQDIKKQQKNIEKTRKELEVLRIEMVESGNDPHEICTDCSLCKRLKDLVQKSYNDSTIFMNKLNENNSDRE